MVIICSMSQHISFLLRWQAQEPELSQAWQRIQMQNMQKQLRASVLKRIPFESLGENGSHDINSCNVAVPGFDC